MPEHPDGEAARRAPQRLDRPILRVGGGSQPFTEATKTLVMMRLDRGARAEDRKEPLVLKEIALMIREGARDFAVPLAADDLGEMLDEVAAAQDVEHLRAATDREHRQV